MLLEVPAIAANQFTLNKTPVSKNFRRFIETQDAKAFVLTSESYRDYIIAAARALNQADWQKAVKRAKDAEKAKEDLEKELVELRENAQAKEVAKEFEQKLKESE